MFLAAVAVCAGISSGFMMTESGSVFPAAAGACILALLVIGADLPRFSAALFVAGITVFFMSYSFYESGGLSACEGQETEIVSKVKTVEMKEPDSYRITVSVKTAGKTDAKGDILVSYYGNLTEDNGLDSMYDILGTDISFTAVIEQPAEAGNPGTFDYRRYLRGCGIGWTAAISEMNISGYGSYIDEIAGKFKAAVMRIRERFLAETGSAGRPLAAGILFGDTQMLDEDEYEAFRSNGTAHVLAVSGLHVGMIYGMASLLRKRLSAGTADVVTGAFLVIYGFITLWSVSVTRAILLIFIKMSADRLQRRYDMLTALSLTSLIIVIREPYALFGAGFQMSFLAVTSIIFFVSKAEKKLGYTIGLIAGVQLPLMLYTAYTFNCFSPAGLSANIPVVFLISLFVPAGIACFLFFAAGELVFPGGGFVPGAGDVVISGLGGAVSWINGLFYMDGRLAVDVTSPGIWILVLMYCFGFFLVSEYREIACLRRDRRRMTIWIAAICLTAAVTGVASVSPFDKSEVVIVDVGQGDCIHLRWPGDTDILIDGGGSVNYNVGEKTLKPYLLKNGVRDIDLAAATHLHTDHYRGIAELSECFDVRREIISGRAGQVLNGPGGRKIEILWPLEARDVSDLKEEDENMDENLHSMIFKVYCEGFTVLITGDITAEGEKALVEHYSGTGKLKADVLKVAHHGSRYSTCDEFLDAVDPEIGVIGVGKNNYGHPADEVIEKLTENDIIVYRTDVHGAIGLREEDGSIKVCTRKRESTHLRFFPRM